MKKYNFRSLTTLLGRVGLALMFVLTCSVAHADSVSLEPGVFVVYESNVATPGTTRLVRSGNSGVLSIPLQVLSTSSASASDYELEWYDLSGIPAPEWRELGSDEALSGSVAFYNGQTTVDIRVRAVDEALIEGREQVVLAIVSPTLTPPPYIVGQFPSRSFIIADDDHKARIEVVQPVADEDLSLRGYGDDFYARRRGIINVVFDSFPNIPTYAGRDDFNRNLSVQIYRQNDLDGDGKDDETDLKLADLTTDYVIKYKICGHNNDATTTDDYSQLGWALNSSAFPYTTGLNYKLMAALSGESTVPLQVQDSDDLSSNVIPSGTIFYFESDPTKRLYTSIGDAISAITFAPSLDRPVPSGTNIKITSLGGATGPDSVIVEYKYTLGTTVLKLGNGWGQLYEGDVINIAGDTQPYVITTDPTNVNVDVNGRYSAEVQIFAHEGGSGGGLAVVQTAAAAVTTLLSLGIQADGTTQILVPEISRKVEFSIEPIGQGDGAEGAEFIRMRMIADYDYVIVTPQDALITVADRDVVAGVAVAANAGLPDIQGTLLFTLSKAFAIPITVPFTLLSSLEAAPSVSAEGVSFETLPRSVTFAPGQIEYLLRVVPKATGTPASLTITLNGTEDYKTGGSTSSGSNPSATMNIINLMGTVTVVATDAVASEGPSADTGLFTVSIARLSGVSGEVALRLGVTGTALVGSRYELFNPANPTETYAVSGGFLTQIKIPAGQNSNSVNLGVRALDNQSADGSGSVQLTVNNTGTAYVIGTPSAATVTVQDNEPTLQVSVLTNATRPSTAGKFLFSYPGVPAGSALDQAVIIKYTLTGAVKGVDFDAQSTVTIPAGSPTRSAELIINPTADGTATSLTLTITDDSAYSVLSTAKSATMTLTAAPTTDPNDPTKDKPKPGSINSGSSSGGCGMGSGLAALVGLGLFGLLAFRRRSC